MTDTIGALHDFHDLGYAQEWADRFVPTPSRQQLFDIIVERLLIHPLPHPHVVELGIGPGYLAHEVLQRIGNITYQGVDFSQAMFEIAAKRLSAFSGQLSLTQADLTSPYWTDLIQEPVGAVISTWALHDLGSEANIYHVYQSVRQLLPDNGLLLNGDFIKPDRTRYEYEGGRLPIGRHIELLNELGYEDVQSLIYLEEDVDTPTPSNNYACFQAICPSEAHN